MSGDVEATIGDIRSGTLMADTAHVNTCSESLTKRSIQIAHFRELVPNPHLLREHLNDLVEDVSETAYSIYTTGRAEQVYAHAPDGLLTVIVPSYNSAAYIIETLESIARQTYEHVHVIVVDDGSSDDTVEIVREFMKPRTNTLSLALMAIPHVGSPSITRNVALYNLLPESTDYVAFMDSDDLYADPLSLSHLIDALQTNPDATAAYGDYDWINAQGTHEKPAAGLRRTRSGYRWRRDQCLTWENLATGRIGVFHLQCLAVRTGTPFIPYRPQGEDEEFFALLFRASAEATGGALTRIVQVPALVAHYRKHNESFTSGSQPVRQLQNVKVFTPDPDADIPPFFQFAGIPREYQTRAFLSEWTLRREVRLAARRVVRRRQSPFSAVKRLLTLPNIRKRDLVLVPLRQISFKFFG